MSWTFSGMRKRVGHSDGVTIRRDDGAAFEHAAQALNVRPGPVREIAQGSLPDLAVLAVTFAQVRVPVDRDHRFRWIVITQSS